MRAGKFFQRNGKLVNAPFDFFCVHCGEPHLQSLPLHRTAAVSTEWRYFYLASLRSPPRRLTIDSLVQPAHRLQSSFDAGKLQQSRKSLSRALHQYRQPFGIHLAHASKVPSKVALDDKIAEHSLFKGRSMPVDDRFRGCEALDKIGRKH